MTWMLCQGRLSDQYKTLQVDDFLISIENGQIDDHDLDIEFSALLYLAGSLTRPDVWRKMMIIIVIVCIR
jgi:hypothetical protein